MLEAVAAKQGIKVSKNMPTSEIHRELIKKMDNQDLFEYYDDLLDSISYSKDM